MKTATPSQIKSLYREAVEAGDDMMAIICTIAEEDLDMNPTLFEECFGGGGWRLGERAKARILSMTSSEAMAEVVAALGAAKAA